MPIGFGNLSGPLQAKISGSYPDIGQTFYLIDSNYRTAAQGWSKSDRTGPLDFWAEAKKGYVFRTGDYSTDGVCIQAAIDAMVDFRGDALYFTPGAYSIATTALSVNVPDARWLGSPVSRPNAARASITAAVAAAISLTAAADRMEVAFLKFIPLTASHIFVAAAGCDGGHFHHLYYNADGIAANVATQFMLAAGATFSDWVFEEIWMHVDAAQGPFLELDGTTYDLLLKNFTHWQNAGTLACALLDVDGDGINIAIEGLRGHVAGTGAVTSVVDLADQTVDTVQITARDCRGAIGYCAATDFFNGAGAAGEANLANCYLDVVQGGAGGLGTTYTG